MSATPIVVTQKDVKRGAWHFLKPALMVLLSLPVLYILALGPTQWAFERGLIQKYPLLSDGLLRAYMPLNYSINQSPSPFGRFLRGYLRYWSKIAIAEPRPEM
jgi:hypothetical protein